MRRKQKQQTNGNRAIWLVYWTDTNARGFWLVKRTLGWKNVMPKNFLEINRYFALTSYSNTIGQSNNAVSFLGFSLAGKRRDHVDLFIHWLIKQITNTYRNHFSRSYENRYINVSWELTAWAPSFNLNSLLYPTRFCFQTTPVFIRLAIVSTKLTDGTWAILGFWTLTLRSTRAVWSHITRTIIILAVREWAGTWK